VRVGFRDEGIDESGDGVWERGGVALSEGDIRRVEDRVLDEVRLDVVRVGLRD